MNIVRHETNRLPSQNKAGAGSLQKPAPIKRIPGNLGGAPCGDFLTGPTAPRDGFQPAPQRVWSTGLQRPFRRKHFTRQPLIQACCMVEGLGRCLENRFHDVVRVATVHQIDVQVQPPMGHECLKKIFE
jgi:hypothetical protein